MMIQAECDCMVTTTASIGNLDVHRSIASVKDMMAATGTSMNGAKSKENLLIRKQATSELQHLPGRRQAYLNELHKLDLGEVRYCNLGTFGNNIASRVVRNRAIADRINLIQASTDNHTKFETEFREARRRKFKSL